MTSAVIFWTKILMGAKSKPMRLKPELKGALLTLFGITLVLVGLWIFAGLRLGIWTPIEYDRYLWLTANLGVADRLWHGDIKAGDDAEKLINEWRPHMITRFGPWIEMRWFPGGYSPDSISFIGICVISKDGRLVLASSYTDDGVDNRIFFNTLTPAAQTEYQAALKTYVQKEMADREKYQSSASANASQSSFLNTNHLNSMSVETDETLVANYMPSLNGKIWPQWSVIAYVENGSNLWIHPSDPKHFPTVQ